MPKQNDVSRHIVLTSHPSSFGPKPIPIQWGAAEPMERGPIIATLTKQAHRNVIGTHSGSYAIYRALAEVTKFFVYNARKRQEGGDRADAYFTRTECVAGVEDICRMSCIGLVLRGLTGWCQ